MKGYSRDIDSLCHIEVLLEMSHMMEMRDINEADYHAILSHALVRRRPYLTILYFCFEQSL